MNEQNQNHIVEPNKKVSSVDYLISQLQKSKDWQRVLNEVSQMSSIKIDIIGQAKSMHKQEIIESYDEGCQLQYDLNLPTSGKQYYQETFES